MEKELENLKKKVEDLYYEMRIQTAFSIFIVIMLFLIGLMVWIKLYMIG
jgi:hypothetical protein